GRAHARYQPKHCLLAAAPRASRLRARGPQPGEPMTGLSRSLVAAAREGMAPDPAVAARVRAKVAAAVGAASATGGVVALPAPKAGSASLLVKLGAALLVIGAIGGVVVVMRSDRAAEAPRIMIPADEPDEVRTHIQVAAANEPVRAIAPVPAPMPAKHVA